MLDLCSSTVSERGVGCCHTILSHHCRAEAGQTPLGVPSTPGPPSATALWRTVTEGYSDHALRRGHEESSSRGVRAAVVLIASLCAVAARAMTTAGRHSSKALLLWRSSVSVLASPACSTSSLRLRRRCNWPLPWGAVAAVGRLAGSASPMSLPSQPGFWAVTCPLILHSPSPC